jgi:hypothetical protein
VAGLLALGLLVIGILTGASRLALLGLCPSQGHCLLVEDCVDEFLLGLEALWTNPDFVCDLTQFIETHIGELCDVVSLHN